LRYNLPMSRILDPRKIKGLAVDLDGTLLLPEGVLGNKTKNILQKLMSGGMQIIISTGRSVESSEKYRSAIDAHGPMVFYNGAEVVDVPSGKLLHTNYINMDVVDFCTVIARELDVHYQVYLPAGISPDTGESDPQQKWGLLAAEKFGEEAKMYHKHTGLVPAVKDLKKIAALPFDGCIKGMYIADPSKHDEIRRRINQRFGGSVTVMRSYPTFLEIINNGVSKGEGLKIAMEHRGLKPEEVIAFGDEENDVSMFTVASYACVPENAREVIRAQADYVYKPNTEEGLAQYLEEIFL